MDTRVNSSVFSNAILQFCILNNSFIPIIHVPFDIATLVVTMHNNVPFFCT